MKEKLNFLSQFSILHSFSVGQQGPFGALLILPCPVFLSPYMHKSFELNPRFCLGFVSTRPGVLGVGVGVREWEVALQFAGLFDFAP